MNAALFDLIPWTRAGLGWPTTAVLIAMAGAGLTLLLRDQAAIRRFAASGVWIALFAILLLALSGRFSGAPPPIGKLGGDVSGIFVATGTAFAGLLVWLLGGAAAISEERRRSIAPLSFVLVAAAIGAVTASDLLVLLMWQFVIGGSVIGYVLVLREAGEADPARAMMVTEAICLFGAGVALALAGNAVPQPAAGSPTGAIGLLLLLVVLLARLSSLVAALPLVARARDPVLAAEVAVAAIAIPAVLHTLIAVVEQFRAVLPFAVMLGAAIAAATVMLLGAVLAIAARERGPRIGAIAASLIGLAILGACEGSKSSLFFVLIWLGPVPAFLAASSIAGRIHRGGALIGERNLTPQADAIGLLLVLASLALIGLPPFAGFWARFTLIESAWGNGNYGFIVATLGASLILAFALARRAFEHVPATLGPERRNSPPGIALPELLVLGVMSGVTLAGGLYPAPFVNTAAPAPPPVLRAELVERP